MGIKNLKKMIQKHAPGAISDKPSLYNKKIAIDSSILLYKYRYTYKEENFHIQGFLYKVIEFLSAGIIPVFVFDGKPPDAKGGTLDKRMETRVKMKERIDELVALRNEINGNLDFQVGADEFIDDNEDNENNEVNEFKTKSEEIEQIKEIKKLNTQIRNIEKNILVVKKVHSLQVMEFLESLGIPCLQAISESEETCAYLQKKGFVDYVFTEDTDSLTFGATKVIFGEKVYNLEIILTEMGLSYTSFIDFCILCGCDYTSTIPKVGPVNALKLIKAHSSIDNFNINIPETFDYITARSLFTQNEEYTYNFESFDIKSMDLPKVEELFNRYSLNNFFLEKLKILLKYN
jgi:flap endonuclease-1